MSASNDEPSRLPDRALLAALAGLSALERQALELVYFRRYTQRQAAELLSISQQLFADAVSRALRNVAVLMETFDQSAPRT